MKAVKMVKKWKAKPPKKAIENYLDFCGGLTIHGENRKTIAKKTLNKIYGKSTTKKEGK